MKFVIVGGTRGIGKELVGKLRRLGHSVYCVSEYVDTATVEMNYWIPYKYDEPANVLTVIRRLISEKPLDGIIFGEYIRISKCVEEQDYFHTMTHLAANLAMPYFFYRSMLNYGMLVDTAGIVFLLDGYRNELEKEFLVYRWTQDCVVLLMGILNAYSSIRHRINCVETGKHPDNIICNNVVDLLMGATDETNRIVV